MDICLVLGGDGIVLGIENDKYKNQDWGPCAQSNETYDRFFSKWRGTIPPPSKEDMEQYWQLNWGDN